MQSCPECGTRAGSAQKFCNQCGCALVQLAGTATTTVELTSRVRSFAHDIEEGRFPPGAILSQRYQIISLLGRGGMGEVYRANDLLLGQPVALKFLLPAATASDSALSRFRTEVRTARQISHKNVCRVYDIGEANGLTFLSMEYIDGEDLSSLLRRIGKLPHHKALEIAQKLCAGLAAAHDQGIVHRDLKPANIMVDRNGQVRITDFGLASLAEKVSDICSGTPAYMAPEQRAGVEVTAKNDIYALGVVLHEVFTGKRPSQAAEITELDPAIEYVILRCLEKDPGMRPVSALSVAAALPGGDLLKAALAAGEIPSPETVANAGSAEGLRARVAVTCLAAFIISIAGFYFLQQRRAMVSQIPMENSPEVLAAQGRQIARSLGYTEPPVDKAFGWEYDVDCLQYLAAEKDWSAREAHLKADSPAPLHFWYRESPTYLYNPTGYMVTRSQPDGFDSGMLEVVLDSEGRLIEFNAQPSSKTSRHIDTRAADWGALFTAAALDSTRFLSAEPLLTPRVASDVRAAWLGSSDQEPDEQLRVEAAAYNGRTVFFRTVRPWSRSIQTSPPILGSLTLPAVLLFAVVLPIGAGMLAWRNTRIGRGDRRGSFRLALFASILIFLRNVAWQHDLPTIAEVGLVFFALRDALTVGAICWLLYMAFEPYVRRRSPATLISWNRLLAGRFRDPLVGADLLVGCLMGGVCLCIVRPLVSPFVASLAPQLMPATAGWVALWSSNTVFAVGGALSCLFLLTLLLLIVRLQWLAALICIGLMSVGLALPGATFSAVVLSAFIVCCVIRFGLLSTAALAYVTNIATAFPPPAKLSAWYSGPAVVAAASIVALTFFAFHATVLGKPLWAKKHPRA